MKQREYLKKKERLYSTIRLLCVSIATFWRVSAGRCSVSAAPHRYVFYVCSMCPCGMAYTEQRTQFASSGYSPKWRKYYRRFVMLRLNHWWWQMDYSDDVFYTFLCLDSVNCLAVNGTVTSLPSNMEVETYCFGGCFSVKGTGQLHCIKWTMEGAMNRQGQAHLKWVRELNQSSCLIQSYMPFLCNYLCNLHNFMSNFLTSNIFSVYFLRFANFVIIMHVVLLSFCKWECLYVCMCVKMI